MTLDNFKIYVPTLDEECLIPYTLEALLKVFPKEQIEVIDLGSADSTVRRSKQLGVKVHKIVLPDEDPGKYYTAVKNDFSARQKWVLWVDGDEIYPTSSLLRLKIWLEAPTGSFCYVFWKPLRSDNNKLQTTEQYLLAGPKCFNSDRLMFRRAWPKEVIAPRIETDEVRKENDQALFNGIWMWHGVLLKRSDSQERNSRRKKREVKLDIYSELTWKSVEAPWDNNYEGDASHNWTVTRFLPNRSREETRREYSGEGFTF